jgi:hypothetical protein
MGGRFQNGVDPTGQLWMETVMDPQALAPVRHQTDLPEVRQMPRDVRLRRADGVGELADAQLFVPQEEQQAAQSGLMRQSGEQGVGGYMHLSQYTIRGIYRQKNGAHLFEDGGLGVEVVEV